MAQYYSDPERETDPHALPDIETFQLTAREVAGQDKDLIFEYMRRREFRLASMNSQVRDAMLDAMVEDNGIRSGWFYCFCFSGRMPHSSPIGPFDSQREALEHARKFASDL